MILQHLINAESSKKHKTKTDCGALGNTNNRGPDCRQHHALSLIAEGSRTALVFLKSEILFFMIKPEIDSRKNNIRHLLAALTGVGLAACGNAEAADDNAHSVDKTEVTQLAEVVAATNVTRDQCMALATKAEKIQCMKTLKAQRAAELATIEKEIVSETIRADEEEKTEQELVTTIEGLTKVVAIQEGREISPEN